MLLYENTMQVVPLLLIALFLDSDTTEDLTATRLTRWWIRMQDKAFALLGMLSFMTSMFIVAGVAEPSRGTAAIVITTLGLAISLLFARIWRRLDQPPTTPPARPLRAN